MVVLPRARSFEPVTGSYTGQLVTAETETTVRLPLATGVGRSSELFPAEP